MAGSPVKATKRQVKSLLRNQQRARTDAEIPIEGAGARLERIEKRVKKLEDELKMREAQWNEIWEWYKRTGEKR